MQPESTNSYSNFYSKKVQFNFKVEMPRYWCGNAINRTYFFNSLGILSPSFERLFILSMLRFRKQLRGSDLEQPVKSFLAQEAQHDHQISRFNERLAEFGYPVKKLERSNLAFCKKLNSLCSPQTQLAFTMGAEHLIALLSHFNLAQPEWFKGAHPHMAAIWRWHAIEEIEHKSVAFDVYHRVCGGYWRKILAYIVVIAVIAGMWGRNWLAMAKVDKQLTKVSFWWDTVTFAFVRPGILRKLMLPLLAYFKPGFHPWRLDDRHLISRWQSFFETNKEVDTCLSELQNPSKVVLGG